MKHVIFCPILKFYGKRMLKSNQQLYLQFIFEYKNNVITDMIDR